MQDAFYVSGQPINLRLEVFSGGVPASAVETRDHELCVSLTVLARIAKELAVPLPTMLADLHPVSPAKPVRGRPRRKTANA